MSLASGPSKEFAELVREIGETRSKDEEVAIMRAEIARLRAAVARDTSFSASATLGGGALSAAAAAFAARQLRELLLRLVYCEMLGFEVPFGFMVALNATQHPRAEIKRAGYLAAALFLHGDHELNLLNTNSMRKGLESPSHVEVSAALTALCRLVSPRTVPVFFPPVRTLLKHPRADVRKKAVVALHSLLSAGAPPEDTPDAESLLRDALCDRDPSVMAAALGVLRGVVAGSPHAWQDLVPALASILAQVVARKLPRGYDYNSMPAPWVQVHAVEILACLGRGNPAASAKMAQVLGLTLKAALSYRLATSSMVVYSCVRAIMAISPQPDLLDMAAAQIGAFLRSGQPNLRFLGVRALAAALAQDYGTGADGGSGFAATVAAQPQTQMAVIECLESDDDTLRHETLECLFLMCTEDNAEAIAARLLDALRRDTSAGSNQHARGELVTRITQIAERFFPSRNWYLETLASVVDLGGSSVPQSTAESLANTLDPRSPETLENDPEYHSFAAAWFARAVEDSLKPGARRMPSMLAQVAGWILGEHGHLAGVPIDALLENLVSLVDACSDHGDVQAVLISAIGKLCARTGIVPESVKALLDRLRCSSRVDLQQRARECAELLKNPTTARAIVEAAAGPILDIDPKLQFLDAYVERAIAAGAKPYAPHKAAAAFGAAPTLVDIPTIPQSERLRVQAYPAPRSPYERTTAAAPSAAALIPTPMQQPDDVLEPTPSAGTGAPAASPLRAAAAAVAAAPSASLVASALGSGAKKSVWSTKGYAASRATPATSTATATTTTTSSPAKPVQEPVSFQSMLQQQQQPQHQQHTPTRANPLAAAAIVEEQRRRKIARDLFGSSTGERKPSRQATRPTPATPVATAAAATTAQQRPAASHSAIADLLSLDAAPSAAAPTSSTTSDLLFGLSQQPASPAKAPETPAAASLLGLATPSPSSSQQHSLLGSPLGTAASSAPSKAAEFVLTSKLPATPFVAEQIKPAAESRAVLGTVAGGAAIHLLRLFRGDGLGLAILASPVSESAPVSGTLTVSVDAIPNDALRQVECICAPGTAPSGLSAFVVPRVPAGVTVVGVVKLAMVKPLGVVSVRGKATVGTQSGVWETTVSIADFLRVPPSKVTTAKVGSMWSTTHKHEVKVPLSVHADGVEGLLILLETRMHLTRVEIIGTEALMCSAVSMGATAAAAPQLCLAHCRCPAEKSPDGTLACTVSLRAETPQLAEALSKAVAQLC